MGMNRNFVKMFTGLLLLLVTCLPPSALAAEDIRMKVEIARQGTAGARPSLVAAMRQAVPTLWDRLIPREWRAEAENLTGTLNMVSRIVPARSTTLVEFNRQAVFDYLGRSHIAYLATVPGFHLAIRMQNSVGMPMHQTEGLLEQYALKIAVRWGIGLSETVPELIINWKWIDASRVQVTIRGDTRLHVSGQIRDIAGEDPLEYMQDWLEELLLQARDGYAFTPGERQEKAGQQTESLAIWLFLDRPLSLGEQVVLEDAIRSDSRVLRLIPHTYSNQRLRYRLVVRGLNASWVAEWFRQRDFQVTPVTGGWNLR